VLTTLAPLVPDLTEMVLKTVGGGLHCLRTTPIDVSLRARSQPIGKRMAPRALKRCNAGKAEAISCPWGGSDMTNFIQRTILKKALVGNPQLRDNLRTLFKRLSDTSLSDADLSAIEAQIVDVLSIPEALSLPSALPADGAPLVMTDQQSKTVQRVIARFSDVPLRARVESALADAKRSGRIRVEA
jgi:hypothetical protein